MKFARHNQKLSQWNQQSSYSAGDKLQILKKTLKAAFGMIIEVDNQNKTEINNFLDDLDEYIMKSFSTV